MESKKFAVIFPNSGICEGAWSNEAILILRALEENEIDYQCFSPDCRQHYVANNARGEDEPINCDMSDETTENFLDNVKVLSDCNPGDFDALIISGGLVIEEKTPTFFFKDDSLKINARILEKLNEFKDQKKPIGYMRIATFLLPVVCRTGVVLAIGNDVKTIADFRKAGHVHKLKNVEEIVVDEFSKVLIAPAYSLESNVLEAKLGIDNLVHKLNDMS